MIKNSEKDNFKKMGEKSQVSNRTVPENEAFFFYKSESNPLLEKARSLEEFTKIVEKISTESLEFHFYRGDFKRWIRDSLKDPKLAYNLEAKNASQLKGEALREHILQNLEKQTEELQNFSSKSDNNMSKANLPVDKKPAPLKYTIEPNPASKPEKQTSSYSMQIQQNSIYKCPTCGKIFPIQEELNMHIETVHQIPKKN